MCIIQHTLHVTLGVLLCTVLHGMDIAHAVSSDDAFLARACLECGADANAIHERLPIITQARSTVMARLLINHGARVQDNHLLHYAMLKDYEPALVSLYLNLGCGPLHNGACTTSPLEFLIECFKMSHMWGKKTDYPLSQVLEKARLLLNAAPELLTKHRDGYLTPVAHIQHLHKHANLPECSKLLDLFAEYQ